MEAPLEPSTDEVRGLRDCLNDLASIMALPALSTGGEPAHIVSTLLEALLGTLRLAFVGVRLNDSEGGLSMVRVAESLVDTAGVRAICEGLYSSLGDAPLKYPPRARVLIGDVDLSVGFAHLGLQGEIGVVVAGSHRRDFPAQTERLLLDVAANQAALGLQQARAAELAAANEALRQRERESRLIVDSIPGLVALLTADR